jgi:hypothetical protein
MASDNTKSPPGVPSIIPVSDEQSKAIGSLSTFGVTVVTEGSNLARYVGRVLGTTPHDAVGLVIGDPLHLVRTAIASQYDKLLDRILERRGLNDAQPVSPAVAVPLLRAAYDEGRPELQELWASLIVAAMDPKRRNLVRISFIEVLKQFDPLDALVLKKREKLPISQNQNALSIVTEALVAESVIVSTDEVLISVENLKRLNCVFLPTGVSDFNLHPYGRALLRACID